MPRIFVYGLLRSDIGGPMQLTLAREGRFLSQAHWRGLIYRIADYPGAVVSDEDATVVGELYELSDDLLEQLDAYENVPDDYLRVLTTVETPNGPAESWIYLWNRPTDGLTRIESGDFADWPLE